MNRHFFTAAFLLGALALAWVGAGFLGANGPALTMTLIIAAVYGFGAFELHRFRQASATLAAALAAIPEGVADLGAWLARVDTSLQNPVRLRIEGERVALPGPALTPYLVGLLVMLGMLGTFLGMVATLNGTVFALEGTTDVQAIRAAFAAPIKGLGLAFGTSVAGVASSAMLGLMSALCRRERMLAGQLLDTKIATVLRGFSLHFQRQETFKALQLQSHSLPAVVDALQAMMAQMASMSQQLNERLLSNQDSFHADVKGVYTDLARSVEQSLRDSLGQSAQAAGASIKPVVEAAMLGIAQDAQRMHERMVAATQTQLEALASRLGATAATVSDTWSGALAEQRSTSASLVAGLDRSLDAFGSRFEQGSQQLVLAVQQAYATLQGDQGAQESQRMQAWQGSLQTLGEQTQLNATQVLAQITRLMGASEELVRARIASDTDLSRQHGERMGELTQLMRVELGALRQDESLRGDAAVQRLGELQTAVAGHLTRLGTALEEPIQRLIQTASEAPRAAAEVIVKLRQEVSSSAARDNELLEERSRILATLNSLLDSIHHASVEQRAVIDSLVAGSALALDGASSQFSDKVGVEADKLAEVAANVSSSAVEVSALGETFGFAVRSFGEANEKLIANLQRIEGAMDKSMSRSDEQLAYYVAQAREVIDLSVMSQKEIFEELRQLGSRQALTAEEAA